MVCISLRAALESLLNKGIAFRRSVSIIVHAPCGKGRGGNMMVTFSLYIMHLLLKK